MAQYVIESPHTAEECLLVVDEFLARGADFLAKFDWGCMAGEHTGWGIVEANSETAARNRLPSFLRDKARVVKVNKVTPEQVKRLHQK